MALTAVYDSRFNKNYELGEFYARGGKIAFGYLQATYSGTGGLSWTLPFTGTAPMVCIPQASSYTFEYHPSTAMLWAYNTVVTTTAGALVVQEVASDTDFTALPGGGIYFVVFGFGG